MKFREEIVEDEWKDSMSELQSHYGVETVVSRNFLYQVVYYEFPCFNLNIHRVSCTYIHTYQDVGESMLGWLVLS